MSRVALKVAYDGSAFHGLARQPGVSTVEGEILHALVRAGGIRDAGSSRFQSASRTDRGVSALGNVVAFDTQLPGAAVLRSFNGKARGVWAWAVAAVPDNFSARRARERWYRYTLPASHDPRCLDVTLALFRGEHDFRNFTRDRVRTTARIDVAVASREADAVLLDFRAPSFRWNLVRRIVAAVLQVEAGRSSLAAIEHALGGSERVDLGLAPPEPLVLQDVRYDVEFESIRDLTTQDRLQRMLTRRVCEARFHEALLERFHGATAVKPLI